MNQATREQESRAGVLPGPNRAPSPLPSQASPLTAAPPPDQWLSGRVFALLLIVALFAAFPKVLLGFNTFFYRDFGFITYPQAFYERESFLRGELPLWNPYIYCGVPFMAQWGAWYPSYFLNCLFPMPWSVNFFQILHMFMGGCGMYWLVRRWGLGSFAAAFAGFAYVFNGVSLSCLMWISYTAFLAWCPWVLGCTMTAWSQGGRWIPVAALASAMQVLAGAPELTVLFWILVGLLWLRDVFGPRSATGGTSSASPLPLSKSARDTWNSSLRFWSPLGRLTAAIILAAGITMVQMLPFFDLLAHSQRDRNFGGDKWALPGWGWANLLLPLFHCFYLPPGGPWFQPGQYLVSSYYLGATVLVLAMAGAWLMWRRVGLIFCGMALVCWGMATGSNGVLFGWVKYALPWIGFARYPVKLALFPVLLVPILAAWGIHLTVASADRRRLRLLLVLGATMLLMMAGLLWVDRASALRDQHWGATVENAAWRAVLALLALGGFFWLIRAQNAAPLCTGVQMGLLALVPLDAFTHNSGLARTVPASLMVPDVWTLAGKPPPPKLAEGRIMTSPGAELPFTVRGSFELLFTSRRAAEAHSLNLLDHVPKVGGIMILRPRHFDQLFAELYRTNTARYGEGLLDFLSVAWTNAADNSVVWGRRTSCLPVITGGQAPLFASDAEVLPTMTAADFDPRQVVYLENSARSLVTVTDHAACNITSAQFTAHKIEANVQAAKPSLVVLSQSFYHLWRASVDGKRVPLLRANLAFQALQVPAGKHHIALLYRDTCFRIGAVVSLVSLIACGLIWLHPRLPNSKKREMNA